MKKLSSTRGGEKHIVYGEVVSEYGVICYERDLRNELEVLEA